MKFRLRKRFILILIIIGIAALVVWQIMFNKKPLVEYTTVKAVQGELIQTVSETGTIKAIDELELNFLNPGRVASVEVKVGDKVTKGLVLAKLDYSDYLIKEKEANANLSVAQARLAKLVAGASSEDIAVAEAGYQAALRDLTETRASLKEATAQAQKTYDDLVNLNLPLATKSTYRQTYENRADSLLSALDNKLIVGVAALDAVKRLIDDNEIKNYFSILNNQALTNTKNGYILADDALDQAASKKISNPNDASGLVSYYNAMISALNLVFKDVNYCFNALEYSITSSDFTQSELDAFKTTISGQATNISTAITSLQSSKQSYDDAKVALDNAIISAKNALATAQINEQKQVTTAETRLKTAEAQLKQASANSRPEDINLARGQVGQAQAALDLIRNQIANNTIQAPIDGVISQVNYKPGEQTSAAKSAIVMIAQDGYEIEIDVAETDIAKIKINDPASITLDAYGDDKAITGQVMFIEPAETVIQGVTYYKVKIDFMPGELTIKPGMTATAEIKTAVKENVLMIPARAIFEKEGRKYVRVLIGDQALETLVTTGLLGDGGMQEILSGVKAGDEVVTFTKENGKK